MAMRDGHKLFTMVIRDMQNDCMGIHARVHTHGLARLPPSCLYHVPEFQLMENKLGTWKIIQVNNALALRMFAWQWLACLNLFLNVESTLVLMPMNVHRAGVLRT